MLRNRLRQKTSRRGAATVEFALVVPVLVSILMFSMFLTEIVLAKFKLQEAARYVAWEMTSYSLSDYAEADHDKAFDTAMQASVAEAAERYRDFDSVEPNAGNYATLLRPDAMGVNITNQTVQGIDTSWILPGDGALGQVSGMIGKGYNFFLNHFKFNTKGQVQVEVTSRLASMVLPRNYLQKEGGGFYDVDNWGGRDLSNLPVRNRFTLIANGWHLPDGGDAVVKDKRAGLHKNGDAKHGLFLQVERMTFLGLNGFLADSGFDAVLDVARFATPDFMGTFVVAHNYMPGDSDPSRECNNDPQKHTSHMGMNNLDQYPGLDQRPENNDDLLRCFDTAPFRDTANYESSLYANIFKARGAHFMGCKNEMADMPNTAALDPSTAKDKNENQIPCE